MPSVSLPQRRHNPPITFSFESTPESRFRDVLVTKKAEHPRRRFCPEFSSLSLLLSAGALREIPNYIDGALVDLIVGTFVLADGGFVDLILGTLVLADGAFVDFI